ASYPGRRARSPGRRDNGGRVLGPTFAAAGKRRRSSYGFATLARFGSPPFCPLGRSLTRQGHMEDIEFSAINQPGRPAASQPVLVGNSSANVLMVKPA